MTGSEPTLREAAVERDPLTGRYRPIDWPARAKHMREWLRPELLAEMDRLAALPPADPETWTCPTCHTPIDTTALMRRLAIA